MACRFSYTSLTLDERHAAPVAIHMLLLPRKQLLYVLYRLRRSVRDGSSERLLVHVRMRFTTTDAHLQPLSSVMRALILHAQSCHGMHLVPLTRELLAFMETNLQSNRIRSLLASINHVISPSFGVGNAGRISFIPEYRMMVGWLASTDEYLAQSQAVLLINRQSPLGSSQCCGKRSAAQGFRHGTKGSPGRRCLSSRYSPIRLVHSKPRSSLPQVLFNLLP